MVEANEVSVLYLPDAVVVNGEASLSAAGLSSRIGMGAAKMAVSAGCINKNSFCKLMEFDKVLEDAFSHRGAADVAHTDKEYSSFILVEFNLHQLAFNTSSLNYRTGSVLLNTWFEVILAEWYLHSKLGAVLPALDRLQYQCLE